MTASPKSSLGLTPPPPALPVFHPLVVKTVDLTHCVKFSKGLENPWAAND